MLLECAKPCKGHCLVDTDTSSAKEMLFSPLTDEETGPETELPKVTQLVSARMVF